MDRHDWNDKYREIEAHGHSHLWSAGPNQFVERELADLPPGRALDLASGEGRNAVWLAERGWNVTAVDFSTVAIDRGRAAAKQRGVKVEWLVEDLIDFIPEPGGFDLVLISYLQLPQKKMALVLGRAAEAVAEGGTLFLIGHDVRNLADGYGGPSSPEVLYSPEQIAEAIAPLRVDVAETVKRSVETKTGTRTALDCMVRAVREA